VNGCNSLATTSADGLYYRCVRGGNGSGLSLSAQRHEAATSLMRKIRFKSSRSTQLRYICGRVRTKPRTHGGLISTCRPSCLRSFHSSKHLGFFQGQYLRVPHSGNLREGRTKRSLSDTLYPRVPSSSLQPAYVTFAGHVLFSAGA
jgi:hypothetical protein